MADFARAGMQMPARIDYFATSLPNLLVFEEDIQAIRNAELQKLLDLAESAIHQAK
jgi:hypothetical protein